MVAEFEFVRVVMELIQGVGLWAVFLYLFVQERRDHERTRESYREDLREIAGFTRHLRGERDHREIKIVQPPPDVRPLPHD